MVVSSGGSAQGGPGRRKAPKRVTMSEIAVEAGVSVATVSKVLNGNDRVSEETRTRVKDLLSQHNMNDGSLQLRGLPQ